MQGQITLTEWMQWREDIRRKLQETASNFVYIGYRLKQIRDSGMYDGMFICGIDTPEGQATYHYDINPYWDMFKVKELPKAPKWDGHTPDEAIRRISLLESYKGE